MATVPAMTRAVRRDRSATTGLLFIAPFMAMFLLVLVAPLVYALYLSLFRETLVGGTHFVGLDNYVRVAVDPEFWSGVANTLKYGAILIPVIIAGSVVLSLALDSPYVRGRTVFRVGLFLPYAFPGIIATLIWGYLYGPVFGPVTQIAHMIGLPSPDLLGGALVLFSIANISVWELLGYKTVIVYAALQTISPELEEAAVLDGATHWQYARYVKVPMVSSAILLNAIFSIIGTLQLYHQPSVLQSMAPAVITSGFTPNLYAYNMAFVAQEYNYAGALSFTLGALIAGISFAVIYVGSRKKRSLQ